MNQLVGVLAVALAVGSVLDLLVSRERWSDSVGVFLVVAGSCLLFWSGVQFLAVA